MDVVLENGAIKVAVRPDLGGRIEQITDLRRRKDWLWHPPAYGAPRSRILPIGASFDDNWSGGWEEIFPNDAAGEFGGRSLADHGELWSQSWEVVEKDRLGLVMVRECRTVPTAFEKTILLDATDARFTLSYRIRNRSAEDMPFLLKLHPALSVEPGDELLLPDCLVEPVDLGFSRWIRQEGRSRFPKGKGADGAEIDLRFLPERSAEGREFYYCSELARGECGVRSAKTGAELRMSFDLAHFPYVWAFQSFGGWRDSYVAVLEPCTNIPYDLAAAVRAGTSAVLRAGETKDLRVEVALS